MEQYILALDQGTTSSRAILFDRRGQIASVGQYDFPQIYPQTGWVEHDPGDIWSSESRAAADALRPVRPGQVMGIGVTNQRETTVLWDKIAREPVYNCLVWQCRPDGRAVRGTKKQGLFGADSVHHRPAAGRLFLRHQGPLDTGSCARRPGTGTAGRDPVRHGGDVSHLEADG